MWHVVCLTVFRGLGAGGGMGCGAAVRCGGCGDVCGGCLRIVTHRERIRETCCTIRESMLMGRVSTAEGMQVRAFAAHIGKSVQWARKLKREGSREWREFCAGGGVKRRLEPRALPAGPGDDLRRALEAKEVSWRMYVRAAETANEGAGDITQQVALNRAAREAREMYERACRHAADMQVQAGRWVSMERVVAIRDAMGQLADVVQNWETVLAGKLPDEMRPAFHDAFCAGLPAWNNGVKAVDDYIASLLMTC